MSDLLAGRGLLPFRAINTGEADKFGLPVVKDFDGISVGGKRLADWRECRNESLMTFAGLRYGTSNGLGCRVQ
jgi:hypothetical protein